MGPLYSAYSRPIYWEGSTEVGSGNVERKYAIAYIEEKHDQPVVRKGKKVITDIFTLVSERGDIAGDEMRTTATHKERFVICDGESHGYGAALSKLDKFIANLEGSDLFVPIF